MRKLIATVFNYSLDGLLADEGSEAAGVRPAAGAPHDHLMTGSVRARARRVPRCTFRRRKPFWGLTANMAKFNIPV